MSQIRSTTTFPMISAGTSNAFVLYPAFLMAGLSWQQVLWQQQMYRQAWARVYGPQPVRVRLADLPRVLRN